MAKTDNIEKTPEQITQEQLRKENDYIIKNKRVRRQSRRRTIVIILLIFLLIISLLAGATYAIMQFVDESNFRVSVTHNGTAFLSLSNDYGFENPSSFLDVSAPKNMDNCTLCSYLDYKVFDIYNTNGAYEGDGTDRFYIATTFYLRNEGDEMIDYCEKITLDRTVKGMEKAIRIMMIKDEHPNKDDVSNANDDEETSINYGTITVYAAPKEDGSLEEVVPYTQGGRLRFPYTPQGMSAFEGFSFNEEDIREDGVWMTKAFKGNGYVMNSEFYPLNPGEIIKYTVVIWLEGNDEQCVDDILGGQVKLAVEFDTGTN